MSARLLVPVEWGARGIRGGRPGWLFAEPLPGQADIRAVLEQEKRGKGYPDNWTITAMGQILDAYREGHESAKRSHSLTSIDGHVYEMTFPSGTVILLGTQASLRMVSR